jgi:peptidyl-dipeptidase A
MAPDEFAKENDRLWSQVQPFYKNLHCYARARLAEKYGDAVQPRTGPIRADLLGNMWSQTWGNIYDVVEPKSKGAGLGYDLDKVLVAKGYDPVGMVKTGERFYTSLGLAPLPKTFWELSQITKPRDRDVVCHASAWDLDDKDDIRIKMCTKVNAEDLSTIHHELGHNYYQRAYKDQPWLYRGGANDGFHEAIGDFVALSANTPTYLKQINLIDQTPSAEQDIPFPAAHGARQDRLSALRPARRQMALGSVLRSGQARPVQCGLVEPRQPVPGPQGAERAPGRRVRSGRQVPHPRQHALHALLPRAHLSVPVPPRRLPAGRLEGSAAQVLRVRKYRGRQTLQRDDGNGSVQTLAGSDDSLFPRDQHRRLSRRGLFQAARRMADETEQGRKVRLVIRPSSSRARKARPGIALRAVSRTRCPHLRHPGPRSAPGSRCGRRPALDSVGD